MYEMKGLDPILIGIIIGFIAGDNNLIRLIVLKLTTG
jgi:hypothetical protein